MSYSYSTGPLTIKGHKGRSKKPNPQWTHKWQRKALRAQRSIGPHDKRILNQQLTSSPK